MIRTRTRPSLETRTLPRFEEAERPLFECLHDLVFNDAECRGTIEERLGMAAEGLRDPSVISPYSSQPVPIEIFTVKMPAELRGSVRLSRAFVIRRGGRLPHLEIHRNSVQRLVLFRGRGAIHSASSCEDDTDLTPFAIVSPDLAPGGEISLSWDVVAPATWHFPEARGHADLQGVAFHSVDAGEILDEYSEKES